MLLSLFALASVAAVVTSPSRPVPESPQHQRLGVVSPVAGLPLSRLSETHQEMVLSMLEGGLDMGTPVAACFGDDTDDEVISIFNAALQQRFGERYNQSSRWGATASSPLSGAQGDPVVLTYSFVPDGTPVPSGVGEPAGVSNLFAYMNGIYGSPAVWQALYAQFFARWSELSGLTFVYEPNDDGASLFEAAGQIGVRGDLRMAGKLIDGNSNILAYNYFPQGGDMVIDTGDNFYFDTSGNSLRLRNVLAHEHGHGFGAPHVCPVTRTKLMEPTVTTLYDGPRHDDIRNAQRHYGDPFEPDNSAAAATDLGVLAEGASLVIGPVPPPDVHLGSLLSIDANGEQDWFGFTIGAAQRVTVTVTPIGENYDDSDQSCSGQPASCCSGSFTDSSRIADLAVQVVDSDGVSVLGTASAAAIGDPETAAEVLLPSAGQYFIRVYETSLPSQSQLYDLSVNILPSFLGPKFVLPDGAPSSVLPGESTVINVEVLENDDTLASAPVLRYRFGPGAFLSTPLSPIIGDSYLATLPAAPCDATLEFYFEGEGDMSGPFAFPAGGAGAPFSAIVGVTTTVTDLDFESALGWSVSNDAGLTDGGWDRGVPVNCNRGDPPADFDGSGQCFLTDNSSAGSCNSDVDGGTTTLISPLFDVSGLADAELSYARWFSNTAGAAPESDVFVVEVSPDGGSNWVTLEVVGPTLGSPNPEVSGGWVYKTFRIADVVPLTDEFRVRFVASDLSSQSVVEAGVDAFLIREFACSFVAEHCPGDANGDGIADFDDLVTILANWLNDYTPGTGLGDSNGDGVVDFDDITETLSRWLESCE